MDVQLLRIETVDYHTGGEPFRIVVGGVGPLGGSSILDKRTYAIDHLDDVRRLLVFEPRGHADMYGCFVTDPAEGADLGVVFFHNDGYSTACGHGTIALVTWALEQGVVPIRGAEQTVVVDVPSGRVRTVAEIAGSKVTAVTFQNVPSFVVDTGVTVTTSKGEVDCDISFGGAFYASVEARALGLSVHARDLNPLIALGREIKAQLETSRDVKHPEEPRLTGIYGVIFFEDCESGGDLCQRNVTIFADGEVDRSPCGSGTSARLALLDATGRLPRGATLEHRSIVDSVFTARVSSRTSVAEMEAVVTEVRGSAFLSGRHVFELDRDDPIGTGFLLR